MDIRCYSQRLLNPFRGAMNIIEYQGAEAVTTDGVHWDIYVRDTELVSDLEQSRRIQTSDIRYGSWSEQQGLKRGPIYPSEDFRILEARGAIVYRYLLRHHRDLPFPFADELELWLLDSQHQPLALLDSRISPEEIETDCLIDWRAGQACQRSFHSDCIAEQLATASADNCGAYLTALINSLAGNRPAAQWFQRTASGRGIGLTGINLDEKYNRRELEAAAFPGLHIREQHEAPHDRLIADYINWQAPWLLLLTSLDKTTRQQLEQEACKQALLVAQQFRLYPEIINDDALTAARIEAAFRNRLDDGDTGQDEEVMSTFYIELNNITRTN